MKLKTKYFGVLQIKQIEYGFIEKEIKKMFFKKM